MHSHETLRMSNGQASAKTQYALLNVTFSWRRRAPEERPRFEWQSANDIDSNSNVANGMAFTRKGNHFVEALAFHSVKLLVESRAPLEGTSFFKGATRTGLHTPRHMRARRSAHCESAQPAAQMCALQASAVPAHPEPGEHVRVQVRIDLAINARTTSPSVCNP